MNSDNNRLLSPQRGWDSQKRCAYFVCPKGGRYVTLESTTRV